MAEIRQITSAPRHIFTSRRIQTRHAGPNTGGFCPQCGHPLPQSSLLTHR